jgi:hypothetical protein
MQGCSHRSRSRCLRNVMRTSCWIRKRSYCSFLNLSFEGLYCVVCVANVCLCVGIYSFSFVFVGVVVLMPDVFVLVLRLFVEAGCYFPSHRVTVGLLFVVVEVRMDGLYLRARGGGWLCLLGGSEIWDMLDAKLSRNRWVIDGVPLATVITGAIAFCIRSRNCGVRRCCVAWQ